MEFRIFAFLKNANCGFSLHQNEDGKKKKGRRANDWEKEQRLVALCFK